MLMSGSIKASIPIECKKASEGFPWDRPLLLLLWQKTITRLCILMHWNRPESTLSVCLVALWPIFLQIGSLSHPRGPWEQWESVALCGSQPPMRSPSLFPIATSEHPHIPLTFLPGLPHTEALYHSPPPPPGMFYRTNLYLWEYNT